MRIFLTLFVLFNVAIYAYMLTTAPVEPAAYQPSTALEFEGKLAVNERLQQADLIATGQITGPEDVDMDSQGRIYAGLEDGRIVRISEGVVEDFVDTGGRPLGLDFDAAGNLIVADALKGLLMVEPDGTLTTLVTEVDGIPLGFTDDVDVASDGAIYFSDASSKYNVHNFKMDVLEMRPYGRLIRYLPATGETTTLMQDLYFANGVALSQQEDFVLVNETWTYRVLRYWLKGPKAGQWDVFMEKLPGFPDGIAGNGQGLFWLALFAPRNEALDIAHPRPWMKKILMALPAALQPAPEKYGLVLALNENGDIVTSLHDPDGEHLHEVTSVQQVGEDLYFGSLHNDRIGRLSVDQALAD